MRMYLTICFALQGGPGFGEGNIHLFFEKRSGGTNLGSFVGPPGFVPIGSSAGGLAPLSNGNMPQFSQSLGPAGRK